MGIRIRSIQGSSELPAPADSLFPDMTLPDDSGVYNAEYTRAFTLLAPNPFLAAAEGARWW